MYAVKSLEEPGKCMVLLADRKLLDLPLESLSMLQEEGLSSVSRDFSLQFFHSRLNSEEPDKGTKSTVFLKNILEILDQQIVVSSSCSS